MSEPLIAPTSCFESELKIILVNPNLSACSTADHIASPHERRNHECMMKTLQTEKEKGIELEINYLRSLMKCIHYHIVIILNNYKLLPKILHVGHALRSRHFLCLHWILSSSVTLFMFTTLCLSGYFLSL